MLQNNTKELWKKFKTKEYFNVREEGALSQGAEVEMIETDAIIIAKLIFKQISTRDTAMTKANLEIEIIKDMRMGDRDQHL
jgi:hypothetical protein